MKKNGIHVGKGEIKDLTLERVREVLDYDIETGKLTWKVRLSPRRNIGEEAGTTSSMPGEVAYRRITIDKVECGAHRLAWLLAYGAWPLHCIDHIDGNGLNNRISNLREAVHSENARNRGAQRNSKSGIKGVSWHVESGRWQAKIQHHGKGKNLGYYATPEEAREAYCKAAKELHGEFARF